MKLNQQLQKYKTKYNITNIKTSNKQHNQKYKTQTQQKTKLNNTNEPNITTKQPKQNTTIHIQNTNIIHKS